MRKRNFAKRELFNSIYANNFYMTAIALEKKIDDVNKKIEKKKLTNKEMEKIKSLDDNLNKLHHSVDEAIVNIFNFLENDTKE